MTEPTSRDPRRRRKAEPIAAGQAAANTEGK